jgi:hypothetical protein
MERYTFAHAAHAIAGNAGARAYSVRLVNY